MKRALFVALLICAMTVMAQGVKPGIEVLRDNGFDVLKGKRVGLITNPTGVDSRLKSTADILAEADEVELVALFAPEHGIRGDVTAGGTVASGRDAKTGVKVHSLYGKTKRPTAQMLADVDALVYDIQDNGCRSYTFISTMAEAMEAAAAAGKEFVVLDRPNPLGGYRVEGGGVDDDCKSFVSALDIPYIYGLTPGELARYIVGEGLINAKNLNLTVVPMEGWRRNMGYDETGLPWVLPSPHIPEASSCMFYPATGILGELDCLSIGVGYTMPFHTAAAPWIDAEKLCDELNAMTMEEDGVAWRPIHYKPYYGKFKGEQVHGVQIYFTDPSEASYTWTTFMIMDALHRLYPNWKPLHATDSNGRNLRMFDQVVGSKKIRKALVDNDYNLLEAESGLWAPSTDYLEKKVNYHLY